MPSKRVQNVVVEHETYYALTVQQFKRDEYPANMRYVAVDSGTQDFYLVGLSQARLWKSIKTANLYAETRVGALLELVKVDITVTATAVSEVREEKS